jgi:anion-transporting  ArsA/GET3 family ATPase
MVDYDIDGFIRNHMHKKAVDDLRAVKDRVAYKPYIGHLSETFSNKLLVVLPLVSDKTSLMNSYFYTFYSA